MIDSNAKIVIKEYINWMDLAVLESPAAPLEWMGIRLVIHVPVV